MPHLLGPSGSEGRCSERLVPFWRSGYPASALGVLGEREFRLELVQEVESDLEGDVERRELLGAEAAHIVGQGGLGQADQAVTVDRARVLQALRFADGHLSRQPVPAGGHRRADHRAIFRRVAEDLSADDREDPKAFGIGPGGGETRYRSPRLTGGPGI